MEKGYYHPSRGYWQTLNEPSAEFIATFPEGTIEVPLKPGADYEWNALTAEWIAVPAPKPKLTNQTLQSITESRDKRELEELVSVIDTISEPTRQALVTILNRMEKKP